MKKFETGDKSHMTKDDCTCPYCGRPNNVIDQDWYIDGAASGRFINLNMFNIDKDV